MSLAKGAKMHKLEYKHYLFDFYGTLVDIRTDEDDPTLWLYLSRIYIAYGADYQPEDLKKKYGQLVVEQEKKIAQEKGVAYPEVDLVAVFIQLLQEAPTKHETQTPLPDLQAWGEQLAVTFRSLSRRQLHAYPNTLKVLKAIKEQGGDVILLSNAQKAFTMPEIELTGCADYLDKVYISSDYQIKKPQAEWLELVLEENQLNPEDTVMVGNDFSTDMAIAEAVGIDGILLNTFPYSAAEINRLNKMQARVITDIEELLENRK